MNKKKRTTLIRVYINDKDQVKLLFPDVKMPDFFHMSVRSNPFMQGEALLRKMNKKKNVKK